MYIIIVAKSNPREKVQIYTFPCEQLGQSDTSLFF